VVDSGPWTGATVHCRLRAQEQGRSGGVKDDKRPTTTVEAELTMRPSGPEGVCGRSCTAPVSPQSSWGLVADLVRR
jgi:hypothetical protein